MSVHSAHLNDDQLAERYLAVRGGDVPDPRVADHLDCCSDCTAAYDDLASVLDGLRDAADADLDELFPAERLLSQRQEILRQLEHVHRSARVISFPGREPADASRFATRLTPRWAAAVAAAACLMLGLGLGAFVGPDPLHRGASRADVAAPSPPPQDAATEAVLMDAVGPSWEGPDDEDEFLSELELALASPQARELQAFDAITPRVQEISNQGR